MRFWLTLGHKREHAEHLRTVLQRLRDHKLYAKFSRLNKVIFFFGHVIPGDGLSVDPDKIRAVKEWKSPETVTEIRSFMGFKDIISVLYLVPPPMTQLLNQGAKLIWGDKQQRSLKERASRLVSASILAMPVTDLDYSVYTDASRTSLGCVLMQNDHVIAYASRQLRPHEKNYPAHEKMPNFHGPSNKYIFTKKELHFRQPRWLELMKLRASSPSVEGSQTLRACSLLLSN